MYSSGHDGTFNPAKKEVHKVHGNINKDDEENLYLVSKLRIVSAIFF